MPLICEGQNDQQRGPSHGQNMTKAPRRQVGSLRPESIYVECNTSGFGVPIPDPRRVGMTAALAGVAATTPIPEHPGISTRAVRTVLATMARIAQGDGTFRYGLRGSKIATLTSYSLSVVRRAQRVLVDLGLLERVEVGGGRASTRWRLLLPLPKTQQPDPPDTAAVPPRHSPRARTWLSVRMHRGGDSSPPVEEVCEHGGPLGSNSFGPLCPMCRNTRRKVVDNTGKSRYHSTNSRR